MSNLTVSVSQNAHETLIELAGTSGDSLQIVLEKAIENYRRYIFLMQANEAFSRLQKNEDLWQEELRERELWDRTNLDGTEN